MPRYKLTIEYDGSDFVGWQYQTNGRSIQQALEEAVERFCGVAVRVHGAGRTDAGVHARGQCCHIDLPKAYPPEKICEAINAHLRPQPIAALECAQVAEDFDARRHATARIYRYQIVNRRAPLTLEHQRAWQVGYPLDEERMREGAQFLLGHHDFTSFRSSQCQARSPERDLDRLDIARDGVRLTITAQARAFLHNQVRAMVGTLVLVGNGQWTPDDVGVALEARDRARGGPNAPPRGLYLDAVLYD